MQVKDDLLRVVQDAVEGLARVSVTSGTDNGTTANASLATADGQTQTSEVARPAPDGASGYHQIRVVVT